MDRGYDSRVGSSFDVQEIDSGQPLSLTLQQHGLGGLFLPAAQNPYNCSFPSVPPVPPVPSVPYDTFSAVFLVDSVAMIAYI